MLTTAVFLTFAQWSGIFALAIGALALLAFLFKWGIRFRLVGISGFMGVLTAGLFVLGVVPFTRTVVPGAIHFSVVYDNGGPQAVIALPPSVTEADLDATLRQAASDMFSYGRSGDANNQLTIRARTVTHPEAGVSKPLFLGEIKRSLASRDDAKIVVDIYSERFAQLPKSSA